jgi:hypothetical protein
LDKRIKLNKCGTVGTKKRGYRTPNADKLNINFEETVKGLDHFGTSENLNQIKRFSRFI